MVPRIEIITEASGATGSFLAIALSLTQWLERCLLSVTLPFRLSKWGYWVQYGFKYLKKKMCDLSWRGDFEADSLCQNWNFCFASLAVVFN